jgi:diguanylate cyclase (GGDEF)-like protein
MLDVDNLKQLNDTWGHAAGDEVLRELGNLLFRHIRGEDIPCRYGGDEFILILPDASLEVTFARAELICEYVRHFPLQYEGKSLMPVTLSLGVAIYPEHGATASEIFRMVDGALYRAKREGRGRVFVAEQPSL